MNENIKRITEKSIKEIDHIYEFRAFTSLSYLFLSEEIKKGIKISAELYDAYNKKVDQTYLKNCLDLYKTTYLLEMTFQNTVSILEFWFFDTLHEILKDTNRLNKKKQIEVTQIIECKNYDTLIDSIIDSELNSLKYKKVSQWFDFLKSFYNYKKIDAETVNYLAEIKATRDLIVHNNMIINKMYIEKSGAKARGKIGKKIDLSADYVKDTWTLMKKIINDLGNELTLNLN